MAHDNSIVIVKEDASLGSTNKADTITEYTSTDNWTTYGSPTDLWDETWTAANINDSDFGVAFSTNDELIKQVFVDNIRITIYYTI